jgi:hypothetical protein
MRGIKPVRRSPDLVDEASTQEPLVPAAITQRAVMSGGDVAIPIARFSAELALPSTSGRRLSDTP